jgi:zinc transporter ZupT
MADDGSLPGDPDRPFGLPRWIGAALPLVLLAVLLGVLVVGQPFAGIESGTPLPDVSISYATLPHDEAIILHVTNNGPDPVTVSQLLVDDAYWDYTMTNGGEEVRTLAPLQSARITIPYHWNPGWDLHIALVLADGTTVHHTIIAPAVSPGMTLDVLGLLALIGVMVGVIPVALGMLWFPFMRDLSDRWLHAVLLFAAGVLAFLAFDAGFEALEVAESVPGAYEGPLLVVTGVVGAALLVQAVAARGTTGGEPSALTVAYLVGLGIGLHNLAEGLAIGSAFALGRVSLGAFLVIGFMVHNVTEGPAVVAPLSRGERPALAHFVALGALAGAPIILGGWIGGLAYGPTLGALFLAIGVGAIIQVDWEIARMVRKSSRLGTATNILGFLAGFAVMYATDLLVAL